MELSAMPDVVVLTAFFLLLESMNLSPEICFKVLYIVFLTASVVWWLEFLATDPEK
jgi:hypothetical protein